MTTQDEMGVFSNSWIQIGALMPKPSQTAPKARLPPKSKRNHKQRAIATRTMVRTAIKTLMRNPRAGVSFMAIRKFIEENYYKDSDPPVHRRLNFVKRYIRKSLEKGELIRTKGNGVCGSFRLPRTKRRHKKKSSNKKKVKITKRKRKVNSVKVIRKKVRKQLKEMELNGVLYDEQLSAEKVAVEANVDPKKAMPKVVSK
ncbi:histone H1 [Zeugodacus cucurbitae]|uniref:histone H1 n=1 Tax=Zeugodacus cucurbitae TaxID=28588 RepID=UPI0023D96C26|nr:histone H1 [Zeugodacus cucurbitae]